MEGTSNSQNGETLINFLNLTVFQDPNCICSFGLREYFVAPYDDRGRSLTAMRDSSEVMRRHFEKSVGHFSQPNNHILKESSYNNPDNNRPSTLKSDDFFNF